MNEQLIAEQLLGIREEMGAANANVRNLIAQNEVIVDRLNSHEKRLAGAESDVKVWKKVFLGLWLIIAAAGTWAVTWFKG